MKNAPVLINVLFACMVAAPAAPAAQALDALPLDDLDAFQPTAGNWQVVGEVTADPNLQEDMKAANGAGVLVNIPDESNRGNLVTKATHGDLDLELEFMMARGSNSGIYLQGRYEVQLFDSWGVRQPGFGDCAGVYQRRRPDGSQFEGAAPRMNACLAPGLWQTMKISFRAPRFNAAGEKTENARLLEVVVNGVTVHENLALTGPTGGAIDANDATEGPLLIQGDHGPVAFRNIHWQAYAVEAPALDVDYRVYYGTGNQPLGDFDELAARVPDQQGQRDTVGADPSRANDAFAIVYEGAVTLPRTGRYTFELKQLGRAWLEIDGRRVIENAYLPPWGEPRTISLDLDAGRHDFRLGYLRQESENWIRAIPPGLMLFVSGPKLRRTALHRAGAAGRVPPGPILVDAETPVVLRSFVDLAAGQGSQRVTKAVNVGDPSGLHYTLDLDTGAVVQAWRGDFLDASPMWEERGDGSARARGAVVTFGRHPLVVRSGEAVSLRPLGYDRDHQGRPEFRYRLAGTELTYRVTVDEGRTLVHQLEVPPSAGPLSVVLAEAGEIESLGDGRFVVDDRRYYVSTSLPRAARVVKTGDGQRLLLDIDPSQSQTWQVSF